MPRKPKPAPADPENPENLQADPRNTLFGKKRGDTPSAGDADAPEKKKLKRPRPEVVKEDPAVLKMREEKRRKKAAGDDEAAATATKSKPDRVSSGGAGPKSLPGLPPPKPHSAAVEEANKLWERLRSEKTAATDREKLIDEVFALFRGKIIAVLQKHDAARVLQSCFKQGSAAQRDELMRQIAGEAGTIARSHYGHFLLLSIVRHGTAAHRAQLLTELTPAAADLLVHAEGSAVLQLLYADVASAKRRSNRGPHRPGVCRAP